MTNKAQKHISHSDLISMDDFTTSHPLRIALAYAYDRPPNIFGKIYHDHAKLWLYKDLAHIVCQAARHVHRRYGLSLVLYDGLRTMEAQAKMQASPIVQKNPHWLEEPGRLLSPPGAGAHPRGMAIDLSLERDGKLLDMGTVFDHLAEDSGPDHNPAHRAYKGHSDAVYQNRSILDEAMMGAARDLGHDLLPLPQEWWDYRLPAEIYRAFAPLRDADLPDGIRMTET